MLTLARCRLFAVLSSRVFYIIKGNGPQGRLATQSSFKDNLTGKGNLSIWRYR